MIATALALLLGGAQAAAPARPATQPAPADYADGGNWLCRPGRQDACAVDLSATAVAANGRLSARPFRRASAPAFDCFYVYPTVSLDRTPNSDLTAGPEEAAVIANQFARYGATCRTFAPIYRQVTLTALRTAMTGGTGPAPDRELGYRDVVAAWRHYLANDNNGRGIVLIGHSQGSGVLKRLIASEIEGRPIARQMIAAHLIGTNVLVPEGADVGGDFASTPLCRRADQTGCVVSFVSFRDTVPPPATTRFGRAGKPGMAVACTHPAALARGGSGPLDAYLTNRAGVTSSQLPPPRWVANGTEVKSPFVAAPGLLNGTCVDREGAQYLEVAVRADPADPRTDTISGDVMENGQVAADWGLHVVDVNLAMGDLVTLAERQGRAWRRRAR